MQRETQGNGAQTQAKTPGKTWRREKRENPGKTSGLSCQAFLPSSLLLFMLLLPPCLLFSSLYFLWPKTTFMSFTRLPFIPFISDCWGLSHTKRITFLENDLPKFDKSSLQNYRAECFSARKEFVASITVWNRNTSLTISYSLHLQNGYFY